MPEDILKNILQFWMHIMRCSIFFKNYMKFPILLILQKFGGMLFGMQFPKFWGITRKQFLHTKITQNTPNLGFCEIPENYVFHKNIDGILCWVQQLTQMLILKSISQSMKKIWRKPGGYLVKIWTSLCGSNKKPLIIPGLLKNISSDF